VFDRASIQFARSILHLTYHTTQHYTTPQSSNADEERQLDNEIFKLYGSLPGFTDPQKRNAFSRTEDRIEVGSIYLGIYRFGNGNSDSSGGNSGSSSDGVDVPLYIRVDGSNNQCVLLGLSNRVEGTPGTNEAAGDSPLVQIEELPFDQIKKIM